MISLLLKSATGAMFLNEAGKSDDRPASTLQGFVNFLHEDGRGEQLRLEGGAKLVGLDGDGLLYQLAFGRRLKGSMRLVLAKKSDAAPDYSGLIGERDELIVTGWNRWVNDRPYVLLNLRENLRRS